MEWVETTGKTVDEAREKALEHLGVAEDDAEFVIVSEPKAGLFGRLRGEARVQARVRPVTPPPKRTRRQRPDRKSEGGDRNRGGRGGQRSSRSDNGTTAAKKDSGELSTEEGRSGGTGDGSRGQTRTTGSGNGRAKQGGNDKSVRSAGPKKESVEQMEESLTLEQQAQTAEQFLAGLVREFGLQAEVTWSQIDEETVEVSANGADLGLLVGPRGATLAAVQDLTRTFVQRQSENRTDRILVDVAGYREKRSAALRRFAEGISAEVVESGQERALEPMSPADRKVIHDTVNELEGVQTRSQGEDAGRYVVIAPA